ncbi:hypothetical protein P154DRAFT_556871 [Amniculicola lignicola CBS 123094]|uniref:Uncharacterized protein n=1 Tax=Amniculicola lignicola CBS 123094 TaxID=1392246 RepID=A0A6A5WCB8_9PLEO|nr:hypothetical protein P154DRAFT_556871 [Amniculicola lignicola CBS 123094]
MTKSRDEEYQLLFANEGHEGEEESVIWNASSGIIRSRERWSFVVYSSILLISLAFNAILLIEHHSSRCTDHGKSKYTGNTFDTPVTYHAYSPYWNPELNQSVMDNAWDDIDTSPLAIALHDEYAKEVGLGPSTRFPWDTERSVYYLKGYHDLHCLKLIRKAITSTSNNTTRSFSLNHILHCLEGLRQDIICAADDTPMPALDSHGVGDGQVRQCRDWEKMTKWATRLDQHACYKFDDYREATNTLELFAFCPEGSPYREVVEAYFEYHGHKDAYEVKAGDGEG